MAQPKTNADVGFSKGLHDEDGDVWDSRIFIHFGHLVILPFDSMEELDQLIEGLQRCRNEIASTR